jgi:GDP-D-mannose 3', 5'-epimerase
MMLLAVHVAILQLAIVLGRESDRLNCTLFTSYDAFPRIMVTGGAGFIGSTLVKKLKKLKYTSVKIVDNFWRGKLENLIDQESGSYVIDAKHDICNVDLTVHLPTYHVLRNADWVIHLADAVAGISFVFDHQSWLYRENILINTNVLSSAIQHKVSKYIYVGTACSYPLEAQESGTAANPAALHEDQVYPAHPESSYGWSKLMGEYEISLTKNLSSSVLRLHNVYGNGADYADPTKSQALASIIRKAIMYPVENFSIWGDGLQYRDFVFVDDVVDALVLAMQRDSFKGAVQIGTGVPTNLRDAATLVAHLTQKCLNKTLEIKFDTSMRNGDQGRVAIIKKAQRILSWMPKVSISQGISMNYAWVLRDMATKSSDKKKSAELIGYAQCLDSEAESQRKQNWAPPVHQAKGHNLILAHPPGDVTDIIPKFFCEKDRMAILDNADNFKPPRKTIVILLSSTRAGHITFENFDENILKALDADLALAVESQEYADNDAFRSRAKYVWEINPPLDNDYMHFYNQISTQCFNHSFDTEYAAKIGKIGGVSSGWLGCITATRQSACSGQIIFFRWFALQNILREKLYLQYDTVIISRSDFLWVAPHFNASIPASSAKIYVPRTEDSGGLSDRHYMLSMHDAIRSLGLADVVVQRESADEQYQYLINNGFGNVANLEGVNLLWHRNILKMEVVRYNHTGMLVRDMSEKGGHLGMQRWSAGTRVLYKGIYFTAKYASEYKDLLLLNLL